MENFSSSFLYFLLGNDLPSLREHGFWSRANSGNATSASSLRPQGLEFFLPFRYLEIDIFVLPALEHNDIKRHGLFSPSCLRLASVGVIHFASSRHMPSFCFSFLFSFCKHANVAVLTLMARNEKQLLCLLLSSYFFCVSSAQCGGGRLVFGTLTHSSEFCGWRLSLGCARAVDLVGISLLVKHVKRR